MPDGSIIGPAAVQAADEGDWIELLIASERVSGWLTLLKRGSVDQKRQAAHSLLVEVQAKETYVEEAKAAGAVGLLTGIISKSGDEDLVAQAAAIIAALSGPLAGGRKVQDIVYGQHVMHIHEGALGDGLGARVWVAAHCLCKYLEANPETVKGQHVLEIGSGCGLCGLLAAKLGASQVTLTDYEDSVLINLQASVDANSGKSFASSICGASREGGRQQDLGSHVSQLPGDISGPYRSRDEADGKEPCSRPPSPVWDRGNTRVRRLDWIDALPLDSQAAIMQEDLIAGRVPELDGPPTLPTNEKFPVVIGSDLMYEVYHSDMVAAVLSRRLTKEGKAYIALAVRRQAHLDRLLQQAGCVGLRVSVEQLDIDPQAVGIVGRENEYEGGFVLLTISLTPQ